jgi:hypothetical protein
MALTKTSGATRTPKAVRVLVQAREIHCNQIVLADIRVFLHGSIVLRAGDTVHGRAGLYLNENEKFARMNAPWPPFNRCEGTRRGFRTGRVRHANLILSYP